ncbi:MAG: hypothetical protein ACXWRE_11060 [Pseudobdellovibrionaceae bacterium]
MILLINLVLGKTSTGIASYLFVAVALRSGCDVLNRLTCVLVSLSLVVSTAHGQYKIDRESHANSSLIPDLVRDIPNQFSFSIPINSQQGSNKSFDKSSEESLWRERIGYFREEVQELWPRLNPEEQQDFQEENLKKLADNPFLQRFPEKIDHQNARLSEYMQFVIVNGHRYVILDALSQRLSGENGQSSLKPLYMILIPDFQLIPDRDPAQIAPLNPKGRLGRLLIQIARASESTLKMTMVRFLVQGSVNTATLWSSHIQSFAYSLQAGASIGFISSLFQLFGRQVYGVLSYPRHSEEVRLNQLSEPLNQFQNLLEQVVNERQLRSQEQREISLTERDPKAVMQLADLMSKHNPFQEGAKDHVNSILREMADVELHSLHGEIQTRVSEEQEKVNKEKSKPLSRFKINKSFIALYIMTEAVFSMGVNTFLYNNHFTTAGVSPAQFWEFFFGGAKSLSIMMTVSGQGRFEEGLLIVLEQLQRLKTITPEQAKGLQAAGLLFASIWGVSSAALTFTESAVSSAIGFSLLIGQIATASALKFYGNKLKSYSASESHSTEPSQPEILSCQEVFLQ